MRGPLRRHETSIVANGPDLALRENKQKACGAVSANCFVIQVSGDENSFIAHAMKKARFE
ncbi:hypothetical protein [Paraburkholderia sartisoli]|uniref:hypothetical protein n=1 Tax=Paraburkholderia sartisoli TaxID=83784 RepID=UPI0011603D42|nr:hypothetical protein [Paraburkholderia sartisoli]